MKIISFILLLCLALSLYSFIFNNGEILSFEETYKGAMSFVTDTGNIFSKLREGIIATVEFTLGLPEKIGNFFTNFGDIMSEKFTETVNGIGQFFTNLWDNLTEFLPEWLKKDTA